LQVGDSFFLEGDPKKLFDNAHSSAAMYRRKTKTDFRIRGKKEATGVRIWRVS
jgi:hypothetical protein